MTDRATEPPSGNPFDQIDPSENQINYTPKQKPANDNPFDDVDYHLGPSSSATGSFGRGLERNIIPAVGSFPAIGAGAEMGAAAGAPLAPFTAGLSVPVGGLLGGLAGAYLGSTALSSAQNWLLSKAPDSWKEKLGLDDRQQQIDESQHPYASFLGGLAPYALTMRPGFGGAAKLPENATALQKIMAHPVTARLFGGAAMGGMELGNEAVSGEPTDWGKVAISTGFGLVWNKPTRIGERITEAGAKPARSLLGLPEPVAAPAPPKPVTEPEAQPSEVAPAGPPTTAREWNETILGQNAPTIAQAADLGVAGPGITEATFQGGVEPNPSAVMTAQETARTEQSVIGPKPAPDTNALARRIEPETFEQYDALLARQTEFRNWINEYNQPPPELFQELEAKRAALQEQLDAHLAERNGYAGGKDARRLRAQIRDIESQHQDLTDRATRFAAGQAEETADLAMARKHLMATNAELQDLLPKIQSAYRRAAEYSGGETYEHPIEAPPVNQELTTPAVTSGQPLTEESANVAKPEGVNTPAQEIPGQHPAAVAGSAPAEGAVVAEPGQALASPAAREPSAGIGETAGPASAVAQAPKTIEQQRDYIRADVARQLVKAGRPEEEAQAAGALEAAYYETRAARFGGKLGTPEELYEREGPEILGQGQKSQQGIVRQPNAPRKAKFDEARSKPYWNTTIEKAARSFEKYVIDRLDEKGAVNDYLANIDTSGGAYPTSDEMQSSGMRAAYDRLFDTIETRNTDRGVEMYQGAQGGIVLNPHGLPGRDWLGSEDAKPILRITKDGNASTFIHETGHKYLADLLRDSAHPEAPQDLRDDAATVQHWLGIDSPEALTRKAHEKFARGFEQYLREGTAPSPQLASVFAKFKQWLVSIYQTLKGLGKPINDDIRTVFDRLLAENPQRTVIAPETEMQPTLADIHEADALHTEPAQKEAVQAQVDQERQRAYDEYPHEKRQAAEEELAKFYAEHEQANEPGSDGTNPADRGGPDEPGAGGLSEVQPNGGAAQSGPTDGGVGAGTGAQRQGINGAGTGSDGLRGSNDRTAGSGSESNPLAPNPAHTFERAESGTVDKAGNIRVENVTSLEGLAQAIHDSADRNGEFKAVRGAMTEGQKVDLANELNLDPSTIDEAKLGQLFGGIDNLAPKIWALRTLLRDSAQVVFDAMRKVKESNSDEDAAAFAVAAARHDMIQGTVSKVTAEMGRGLGMGFKNLEGWEQAQNLAEFVKAASGKELFQLKMMAKLGAKLDTPAKVSKFLRDGQKRTFGGMLLEYWINGLISGIATHVTYTAGNGALNATRALLEAPTAALIGKLREAMGEQGQHVQFGEVGARVKRGFGSLPAALQGSLEAVQQGVTTLLPGETGRAMMPFAGDDQLIVGRTLTNEPVTWGDLRNDVAGAFRGMRNGIIGTANLVGAGGEAGAPMFGASYTGLGQIPDLAFKGVPVLPVGTAIRAPGRMIAGIHSFFRISTYSMELAAEAYRTATYEGLEGEAFAARAGDLIQNPTEAMMARATKTATEQALMGQGSAFTQSLSKLTNTPIGGKLNPETGQIEGGIRLLKFVDPFVHIASNVIDQSIIKRTPLGLLSPELRHDLMGRPDPLTGKIDIAARDMAQARMLVGSALGVTFAGLASQGYISGSGPSDAKQGAMWRLAGNQAHSVKIGDIWYDVHRLGPLGMLLGISADMYDVAHTAAEGDIVTAASHLQHALTQNILDESFMRGPSALIQAIEDPERYGQQYIENTLASFVPFSVGMAQMERASDPYSRRARTVMDAIKAKVPGLSETLYPKRDIWGNEIPNLPSFGGRAISAFYEQQISHDPVNIAMIQLGISPAQVERKIRNIDLDDGQYDDFSRLSGRMSKQRLDMIVRSPDFQSWPNNIKVNVITEVIRQSREAARGMMMMKYPDLLMQGVQAQKDKRLGVDAKSVQRRTELNR